LQNIVERAVVMARDNSITTRDLPPELQRAEAPAPAEPHTLTGRVEQLERQAIAEALEQAGGVQSRAAALLGLTERNLRYKLKKYGIKSRG
jgi:two-component system NtrC family response regulator